MKLRLLTSKDLYDWNAERGHIDALQSLGFSFEDYGNGLAQISGDPELDISAVSIFQNWVEVIIGNGTCRILDWMSTNQLLGL